MSKLAIIKFIAVPLTGAFLGFLYYKFIGCSTGTCAITSNLWLSTLYGLILGLFVAFL
jgi:hypothetical protein